MKMRMKILFCFLLSFSAAFIILLLVVRQKTSKLSTAITQDLTQQLVRSRAEEVGAWFAQRIGEMRIAGKDTALQELNSEEALSYLSNINALVQDEFGSLHSTFALLDESGFGWVDRQTCIDLLQQDYFAEAMVSTKEYHLSMPTTSLIDGQRAIIISYPLKDEHTRYGYMVGTVSVAKLQELLTGIRVFDGTVWLMDREGRLIAEGLLHETGTVRDPRQFSLKRLSDALDPASSSQRITLQDGDAGYLTYTTVPYTPNWLLCVLTSEAAMYSQSRVVEQSIAMVWLCILVAFMFLCMALADSLTRPLVALRLAMDSVEVGSLHVHYEPKGRDEVASLGNSFNEMLARIRHLLRQVSEEQNAKHAAELRVLQSQINPHFIYNTLDTLHWKALAHNAPEIADITAALSAFFRISLSQGREFITLNEEVEHAYHYLFIQQVRYSNRLSFDIALEPALNDTLTPKLLLQPLLENALQHGIKPVSYKGHILVSICPCPQGISITVKDNGAGMPSKRLTALREQFTSQSCTLGYGLFNINERLRLLYGHRYNLQIESAPGTGTQVRLVFPVRSDPGGESCISFLPAENEEA